MKLGKYYYGVRTSKDDVKPKDDIGIRYFSSSRDKWFMSDQQLNPQDYKYKVIRISETRELAIQLEIDLQERFDAGVNPKFFNKIIQPAISFSYEGMQHNQYSKDKISAGLLRRSPEEKAASVAKINATMLNKSEEEKAVISAKKSITWKNRSDADKIASRAKYNRTINDRSLEEEDTIRANRQAGRNNRTAEEKLVTSSKMREAHHNRSPEYKDRIKAKRRASCDDRTTEEKAITTAKMRYSLGNRSPEKKAATSKILSAQSSGSNNPLAKKINIYDSVNVLRFECNGNFKKICKENNLPFSFLTRCYQGNLPRFKRGKHLKYFERFESFEGWYARKIEK